MPQVSLSVHLGDLDMAYCFLRYTIFFHLTAFFSVSLVPIKCAIETVTVDLKKSLGSPRTSPSPPTRSREQGGVRLSYKTLHGGEPVNRLNLDSKGQILIYAYFGGGFQTGYITKGEV